MLDETCLQRIPLAKCFEDPTQPRQTHSPVEHKRLLASIMKIGQLVPGHVQATEDGRFRIDAGARRFRALQAAREKCPEDERFQFFLALVDGGDADERRRVIVQWASNVFRADIPPIDKALYIARISDTLGSEIRADLGITENDWRICRQVASAPQWLQKFGGAQRYEVVERDANGVVQVDDQGVHKKKTVEKSALPLVSIVRLMRHLNKVKALFIARDGTTKGEALTYQEVHRLAYAAQREEWSKRQLDDACNRSWERISALNGDDGKEEQKWTNDHKQLRIVWQWLAEMTREELEELELTLTSALERVRFAAAAATKAALEHSDTDKMLSA